jgi:hypothetical protein
MVRSRYDLLTGPPGVLRVTRQTRSAWLGVPLSLALAGGIVSARAQQPQQQSPVPPPPAAATTGSAATTAAFVGTWDYNPAESVNAANGRPEQNAQNRRTPPSSGQPGSGRSGGGGGGGSSGGGGGGSSGGGGGGSSGGGGGGGGSSGGGGGGGSSGGGSGGGGGGANPGGMGPTGMGNPGTAGDPNAGGGFPAGRGRMMAMMETRELMRDLMEIPEKLTIKVASDAVTVTDDLGRERVYPTDNKKRKYQFGAAVFDARARWEGAVFKMDMEAARGFKMFQTCFLSDDGNRLFVIIRVGEQSKNAPVVGVNRVYDRQRRP